MVGMVTRMTGQKGVDLLRDALDAVMRLDLQLVMLASGDVGAREIFQRRGVALSGKTSRDNRVQQHHARIESRRAATPS